MTITKKAEAIAESFANHIGSDDPWYISEIKGRLAREIQDLVEEALYKTEKRKRGSQRINLNDHFDQESLEHCFK